MNIFVEKVLKADKKDLLRFYKQQHYRASFIGYDHAYIIKKKNNIIAAVIISTLNESNKQCLLHGLVVAQTHRHLGFGQTLLEKVTSIHTQVACFAIKELSDLYYKTGFTLANEPQLTPSVLIRYQCYKNNNAKLLIFYKDQTNNFLTTSGKPCTAV